MFAPRRSRVLSRLTARVLVSTIAAGALGGPDEGVLTTALVGCGRPADSSGVDLRVVDTEVCVVCVMS